MKNEPASCDWVVGSRYVEVMIPRQVGHQKALLLSCTSLGISVNLFESRNTLVR
jgi:hypothetical protein